LVEFAESLNEAITPIPESRDAYTDWIKQEFHPEIHHEPRKIPQPTITHIDVFQLKEMIQRLAKDEDHHEVVTIVQRFEPEFAGLSGTIELDIKKCRPETLVKLYDFAVRKAPPPPPKTETPIRRATSTPMLVSGHPPQAGQGLRTPNKVSFGSPFTNPLPEPSPVLPRLSSPPPPSPDLAQFLPHCLAAMTQKPPLSEVESHLTRTAEPPRPSFGTTTVVLSPSPTHDDSK
jgi:hypothetical protein